MKTVAAKTILQKNKTSDWFGNDYNINLYRGCCHGCIYCDSRSDCYHIDDFDTVCAKENAITILKNELRRKTHTGIIGTGSMSDPYNPFEKTEFLTRNALELIDYNNFGVTVITKSSLITRDIDMYKRISEHSPVLCKMTLTTADDKLCKLIEPNVSVSSERFEALAKMSDNGIFTGITMMPILPFIEDSTDNIIKIIRTAHECGVKCIYPAFGLTLRSNQREYYLNKLDLLFPNSNLRKKYISFFGNNYECTSPFSTQLWHTFVRECEKFQIIYNMKDIIATYKHGYDDLQLSFF